MSHHMRLLESIHRRIARIPDGHVAIDARDVYDVLPHYWREEADTPEEWFIRTCRGLGMHVSHRLERNEFVVRRTRSVADEATITWPARVQ